MSNTYNLFISHSWAYGDAYTKLISMLDSKTYFSYRDYSVPKYDPIHTSGSDRQLHEAIKRKIAPCNCVLILAGVYSTYSKWINNEIVICSSAFAKKKPIIAIEPWAALRTSKFVKDHANRIVRWNTDSIVRAIREVAI